MHSFQPTRGRILFEVFCAVGIAASCGGAWMQTGASALLAASAVATLYGLVHFFDLFRREPSVAAEPQRVEFEPEPVAEVPVHQNVRATLARIEEQLAVHQPVVEAPLAEIGVDEEIVAAEPPPTAVESPPAKAPRKASGRRASTSRKAKGAELAPVELPPVEVAPVAAAPVEEEGAVELSFHDEPADEATVADEPMPMDEPRFDDEPFHSPVAPLFEPEPFVRVQQRSRFGRKAG